MRARSQKPTHVRGQSNQITSTNALRRIHPFGGRERSGAAPSLGRFDHRYTTRPGPVSPAIASLSSLGAGHGAAERAAYAADIRRNQATHDALSPLQRADVLVKLARLISRFESRDDVYAYGNGLPVLNDDAVSDPRCTRYSMALIHRALALVAHLPGLESRAVRRGVWADLHHGLAAMGRYDDQNLIARRLFLESPAGVPPTPAPHGPHALASDREMGMRAAAAAQHYVGAGNNEELLRNLAGVVVVPATEEEARAERERKAAAAEAPPTDEEQYVKTYRDMARATSSAVITSPPVPLSYDVTSGSNGNTRMYDFPRTTRARLRHDREQLAYLASTDAPDEIRLAPEIALPAVAAYDSVIAELGGVENVSASDGGRTDGRGDSQLDGWLRDADAYMSAPVELNLTQQVALAPYFNRELARRDEPRVPGGALAWDTLRVTELSSEPRVIMVDDVFRPEALEALIRFNRGTTMWTNVKKQGYLCAYPSGGYATPLLGQVAEELPLIDPELSCAYQLVTSWAYLYDDVRTDGIGIHADIARVNINCWITPDDANLDPPGTSGGMVIVPARPPGRWHNNFAYYNSPNASDPAFWADLNAQSGGRNITVAHKQNRCVIFDSELYHWTDRVNFKRGYDKRRINLTFLYGHPGDKTCRMRGGGSPARRKALAAALEQRAARENQPAVNDGAGIGGAATNDGASGAPPREAATGAEPTVPASFASTDREL